MALEHKNGYNTILDLLKHEDIYPGACICTYKGKYFPSMNRVRKTFGGSALPFCHTVSREKVRTVMSVSLLNI